MIVGISRIRGPGFVGIVPIGPFAGPADVIIGIIHETVGRAVVLGVR